MLDTMPDIRSEESKDVCNEQVSKDTSKEGPLVYQELNSTAPIDPMPPLRVFSQEFTLVACDGEEFDIPIYHLMSWSGFFRGLLETGDGALRVELDESYETLEDFKELIDTGALSPWGLDHEIDFFQQILNLAAFLDKYDCSRALNDLIRFLKEGVRGSKSCETGDLPPLILFAVGARLDQSELCEMALDLPRGGWGRYADWAYPFHLGLDLNLNTLHPHGIPYRILSEMPFDYMLALTLLNMPSTLKEKGTDRRGEDFARVLKTIRESAERAKKGEKSG